MAKEQVGKRVSGEELEARRSRGESRSDFARVRAKTETELERDIGDDPEFRDVPPDWHAAAEAVMPPAKQLLSLRLDTDIVAWFRDQGAGYQTRINAVLRAYLTQQTKARSRASRQ